MDKLQAINLLIAAREGRLRGNVIGKIEDRERRGYVLRDGTLVLLGVNSQWQLLRLLKGVRTPGTPTDWHAYVETYAREMAVLIARHPVKSLIGHSLGGATAQYLAVHHGLRALTFAAPRVYRGSKTWSSAESRILNIVRHDDPAELYLKGSDYRRLGETEYIKPGEAQSSGSHRMIDYRRIAHRIAPGSGDTRIA